MKAKRVKKHPSKVLKKVKPKAVVKAKAKATSMKGQGTSSEHDAVKKLQKDVSLSIVKYMDKEKIGFNELARRLRTSPTQTQKIQKGNANLTMASVAHIAAVMKKKVRLVFE
ncbi:MAG TPA: hypothetical protein VGV92_00510 [Gammaproteobacteria bacterium]|nr:hypothetical protein [Gammaproteobacteria bacterium]